MAGYEVIKNEKDIEKYQNILIRILQFGTDSYKNINIGHQGGARECDVYWLPKHNYWSASLNANNDNRYLNWFGTIDPNDSRDLSMDVQISISKHGARAAGKFVKNENKIIVVHNGNIKKSKASLRTQFWDNYKNDYKIVKSQKLAFICELPIEFDETKYLNFQEKIKEFIDFVKKIKVDISSDENKATKITNQKKENKNISSDVNRIVNETKPKAMLIKKSLSEQPHEITKRIEKLIRHINKNQKNNNKAPTFDDLFSVWSEIEDVCNSKNDLKNFALNLYIIIYERTREKKSNYNSRGNPYTYRLPNEFIKIGTETREFFNIVGALRHEYAHSEPEYNIPIKKISYPDVLEKLLGNRNEPTKKEEFQKLQIEILKRFEESMKILLEIVKKETQNRQ